MKKIYFVLVLLFSFSASTFAQTLHTVNSGSYYYTPSTFTINVGDTVTWLNDGGLHNVNFDVSVITGNSFGNPESFASSPTTGPVLYTHVFTIPGSYSYDCSVGAHAQNGMVGSLTVNTPSLKTYVPDDNFENYLESNGMGDGIALNDSVLTSNIDSIFNLNMSSQQISDLTGIEDFTLLRYLNINSNQIANIDVSNNIYLRELKFINNSVSSLNISTNVDLIDIQANGNQLSSIDVSHCTDLVNLQIGSNLITSIDVSNNLILEGLAFFGLNISSLDVSNNTLLKYLNGGMNSLSSIDVSNNPNLVSLTLEQNQLSSIDLSNNNLIQYLYLGDNSISTIDVSNLSDLYWFKMYNNQLASIDVTNSPLLNYLDCRNQQISNIDLSNNLDLEELYLTSNQISSIDLSNNTQLEDVVLHDNLLTSIVMDNHPFLERLGCDDNFLTNVDVTNNCPNLFDLQLQRNQLTQIDVTNNPDLIYLQLDSNQISSVDISNNLLIEILSITSNPITNIDVTNHLALERLSISNTQIGSIDLSNNSNLFYFWAHDCYLNELDIRNGNNTSMNYFNFRVQNNPNLACISVDDTSYSSTTWILIDPQHYFSDDCNFSPTSGCTDSLALNYDSTATNDDGSCIYPTNTVYDIVANSVDHTTLKVAVDTCSLDGTLSGPGPFTLFAPTDAAFNALPAGTVPALLNDIPLLTNILLHHVLGDSIMSTMLSNGQVATTLLGTNLTVTINSSGVYIDNAMVTVADIVADNGVVHVIDVVLLPNPGCTDPNALNYDSLAIFDNGSCLYTDCNGIAYGTSLIDDCGVCQQAYVFNLFTQNLVQYVLDTTGLILGSTEVLVMPNDLSNSLTLWNSSCSGCTDPAALNYDSIATINDGSCNYGNANLFISEYAEGSTGTTNRYFEIFNPTSDTIDLFDYAWARVTGNPTTVGVYETWHDFNPGAVILPNDVYVVAHTNANAFILNEADMISTALSNGDDGMALIYGVEPLTPTHPDSGLYQVLDWIGDWNGDPGQGWDVAGEVAATRDHTLVRKCDVMMGDTSWTNAAGTDPLNSQWVVLNVNTWDYLGSHSNSPVYSSYFDTICNGLSITVNGNIYNATGAYTDTLVSLFGCDSIVTTNLYVLPISASFLNISATICDGDSVYVGSSIYFETGIYTDVLTNSVGCDSIITTDLTVQTPTYLYYDLCAGDSAVVGTNVYSSAGIYVDSLVSSIGCDSLVITEVTVYSQFNSIFGGITDNTVGGGGYYTGDQHLILDAYSPTNIVSATVYSDGNSIYEFELRDNNGNTLADTIYALNDGANFVTLNFEMPVGTDFELGVSAASGFEGLWRNNSGVSFPYVFGNLASITQSSAQQFGDYYYFFYNLEMKASNAPAEYSICQGDSIVIGSSIYTTSGSYVDTMISVSGCDSIVLTNLTVNPIVIYQNNQTVCLGETYTLGNNTYSVTGTYIDSFQTSFGCDSLVYTNLIVNQISGGSSTNNTTICYGDFFMVGSNMYTNSGTYIDVLTATNGCDSTVTTNLTVLSANYPTIFGGIPDSIVSPGGYFNFERRLVLDCYVPSTLVSALIFVEDSGTVTFELRDDNGNIIESSTQNVVPGPQRVTLNFSMPVGTDYELGLDNPNQIGIFRSNSNVNYPYNFGSLASITGSTANAAGYYYFYYDIELSANVTPNVVSLCDGNSVTVGSNTYSTTGIYYDTLNASNFCDSIIYTDLTVSQPFVPSISTNPFDGKICIGDNALITASAGFVSYSWDNGMSGQVITVSPTTDQLYTLTTVDVNGCSADNSVMIYVDSCSTDISELSSRFSIYPNPSSGIVNIEFNNSDNNFNHISIINVLGEEIFVFNEISNTENFKTLDFASYAKGVYLIKIKTDVGEINKKLIIE